MSSEGSIQPQRKKIKGCEDCSSMDLALEEKKPSPPNTPVDALDSEEDIFFDCSPINEDNPTVADFTVNVSAQIEEDDDVARAMELQLEYVQEEPEEVVTEKRPWRGTSLAEISRGCDSPQLPPVTPSENHAILFQLPYTRGKVPDAFPQNSRSGKDAWDSDHVRMPCSPQSLYAIANVDGKNVLKGRWEMVCEALKWPITTSLELQEAILAYNSKYSDRWDFSSLHTFFNEVMDEEESAFFFSNILPKLITLALDLPSLVRSPIPLLRQHREMTISLSQLQVASLLANAFLCTFPRRNTAQKTSEYAKFPDINFNRLFGRGRGSSKRNVEKLKCIFNYFRRVLDRTPDGVITFTRRFIERKNIPRWDRSAKKLSRLHVSSQGTIEDQGGGMLQVDFANSFVGGGVLGWGCVQEEIRFLICPELILSRLFTEELDATEALLVTGCERYNTHHGYADSFLWSGDYADETPRDSSGRRHRSVIAIDALYLRHPNLQFSPKYVLRELNKAFVGFHGPDIPAGETLSPVATGNWGCGVYRGKATLKALIQLMSASEAGRDVVYFTFHDHELRDQIYDMHTFLAEEKVTVGRLWRLLCQYHEVSYRNGEHTKDLYAYLYQAVLTKEKPVVQTTLDRYNSSQGTSRKQTEKTHNQITPPKKRIEDRSASGGSLLDSDELKKALEALPDFEDEPVPGENGVQTKPKPSPPGKSRLFEALDSSDGAPSASNPGGSSSKFLEAFEQRQRAVGSTSVRLRAGPGGEGSDPVPSREEPSGDAESGDRPQPNKTETHDSDPSRRGNGSYSSSGTSTPKTRISDYFQNVSKPK